MGLRLLLKRVMNLSRYIEHLDREWDVKGWPREKSQVRLTGEHALNDEMQYMMYMNLRELLQAFADQGHSGFSSNYALNYFDKLARFKPVSPLTGEDSEWNKIGEGKYQNNRCSHVFKEVNLATGDESVYDSHGKVFIDGDLSYTSMDSRVRVDEFPYVPEVQYVYVSREEVTSD